jgi:transposase
MENRTVVAVDIAKNVFEIAVSEIPGQVSRRERLSRSAFLEFFKQIPSAIVVMEACGSATHWGRQIEGLGHSVTLLPAHHVRPYITRNKTDRTDAKGILEAYRNKDLRPVPMKTTDQQVVAAIHRFRAGWISSRTAQVNTLRGLLREIGVAIPMGIEKVLPQVRDLLEDADSALPDPLRPMVSLACDQIETLTRQVKQADRELAEIARRIPEVVLLLSIPGFGLIVATAFFAVVGDVHRFPSGRHVASYLGLTPRERSSGTTRRFGRISKRGNSYVRMQLVHGSRSVLGHAKRAKSHDRLRLWVLNLHRRTSYNKAAVGLASKLARVAWAVLKHGRPYEPMPIALAA